MQALTGAGVNRVYKGAGCCLGFALGAIKWAVRKYIHELYSCPGYQIGK